MIKAIKTEYGGVLFRSRLEARWAVFFDALEVHWEYEPEAFRLPSGACYLPDFRLPELGVYAEVKPDGCAPEELALAKQFASAEHVVVSCYGPPWSYSWGEPTGPDALGAVSAEQPPPERTAGSLTLVFSATYGHIRAADGFRRRAKAAAKRALAHRFWEPSAHRATLTKPEPQPTPRSTS